MHHFVDNSKNSQFGLPKLGVFSWRIWRGAAVFAEARHCPGKFSCGQRRGLVVFAFQKPQTLSLRRSISLLYMPRRGEVFILAKRGAIGLSRFQPRRQLYFGGGERQSCQASHLPLLRQDDCRNFAPLERGHLDSKPLFCPFSGSANFLCRRNGAAYFPSAPPGKPFPLSRRIPALLRLSPPPRFKIRALGLSFRKKQDIIAVYLVTKESKGFLN